jgi:hypothetical protein
VPEVRPDHRRLLGAAALAAALLASTGASGCGGDPTWSVEVGPLKPVLLSVWGTGATDVWAVGGSPGSGTTPPAAAVLHYDGHSWSTVDAPFAAVLWWVFGFAANDVWICGEYGTVLHWDGTALSRKPSGVESPTHDIRLYGLWGAAPDDIYVVGGDPDNSATVLHFDGSALSPVAGTPTTGGAWFKVWGSARDDVYLVGQYGSLAHFDGATWTPASLAGLGIQPQDSLFTASGSGRNDVYVVGGPSSSAKALHFDGKAWSAVAGLDLSRTGGQLTGVHENAGGDVVMTGIGGEKFVGRAGSFRDDSAVGTSADLHAVWFDAVDNVFAAGGNFFAQKDGIVARLKR